MAGKKKKFIEWDDCIHIGACRRFSKIVECKTGKHISRGCGKECNMFISKKEILEYAEYEDIDEILKKLEVTGYE